MFSPSGDCGCEYTSCLNETGNITSVNYPNNYPDDSVVTTLIEAPPGQTVTIAFSDFEVEYDSSCDDDFLVIYDGSTTSDTEIGTYCGTTGPGCVHSSAEYLLLSFTTDSFTERRGYFASFNFVGKSTCSAQMKRLFWSQSNICAGHNPFCCIV